MRCNSPSSLRGLGPIARSGSRQPRDFRFIGYLPPGLLTSKVISAWADIALAGRIDGASTNASGHSTAHIHPICIPRHA
jgi:hypothetical protein